MDRLFWTTSSTVWSRWVEVLLIVKPATVVGGGLEDQLRLWLKLQLGGKYFYALQRSPCWTGVDGKNR